MGRPALSSATLDGTDSPRYLALERHVSGLPQQLTVPNSVVRRCQTIRQFTPPGDDYIARRIAELLDPGGLPRSDADRRAIARDADRPARPRLSLVDDAVVVDAVVVDAVVDDAVEPDGDPADEDEATGTTPEGIATGKHPAPAGFPVFDAASPDWRF